MGKRPVVGWIFRGITVFVYSTIAAAVADAVPLYYARNICKAYDPVRRVAVFPRHKILPLGQRHLINLCFVPHPIRPPCHYQVALIGLASLLDRMPVGAAASTARRIDGIALVTGLTQSFVVLAQPRVWLGQFRPYALWLALPVGSYY